MTIATEEEERQEAAVKAEQAGTQKLERLVVCVTGMPGAGKSTVADAAQDEGFQIFRMGDDVRMEAERRGVPPSDENLGAIMMELRQRGGSAAVAALCKRRIERESKSRLVVIDGIRNMNELFEFKKLGNALLIAVHASPKSRYRFLQGRRRSDSPNSYQAFEGRDRREMTVGVAESIAMADEMVVNSSSLDELRDMATQLFRRLKETGANSPAST